VLPGETVLPGERAMGRAEISPTPEA
jgi:hypothetical protein